MPVSGNLRSRWFELSGYCILCVEISCSYFWTAVTVSKTVSAIYSYQSALFVSALKFHLCYPMETIMRSVKKQLLAKTVYR